MTIAHDTLIESFITFIGKGDGFLWSGSTMKTCCDHAVALAPRRDSTPIEARCLVKVSVVDRGLS